MARRRLHGVDGMKQKNPSDRPTMMTPWQVKELENELESEQKKGQEYQKIVRKYERRIKELSYQVNTRQPARRHTDSFTSFSGSKQ